jgi:protein TonB
MKKLLMQTSKYTHKALFIACGMLFTISSCTDKPKTDETQVDTLAIVTTDSPKVVGNGNGTLKVDTVPIKVDSPVVAEIVKLPAEQTNTVKPPREQTNTVKLPREQTNTVKPPKEPKEPKLPKDLVENPDQPSSPTGGYPGFYKFVRENLKYPELAIKEGVEGSVRLQFVVSKDGSISHIKVIAGIGSGCDEEAVRIVKQSPKWQPAVDKGNNVASKASIPISFKLK